MRKACCFTGHRPERLGFPEDKVITWLEEQVRKAYDEGYTDFITGMQRGVDIWAAEAVMKLKYEGRDVRLIAAVPFEGCENGWSKDWRKRFNVVLAAADETYVISSKPGRAAFFQRNYWMVDHSQLLIAVFSGARGGTEETIKYAEQRKKTVVRMEA